MDLKRQFANALVVAAIIALSAAFASAVNNPSVAEVTPDQPVTLIPEIPAPPQEFTQLDLDKSGSLSKNEAMRDKALIKRWEALDANKDGKLDADEYALFESRPSVQPSKASSAAQKSLETLKSDAPVM